MAVTQTGSLLQFTIGSASSGTVSSTITVPADADFVVVGVHHFANSPYRFSGGSMTFTKGGVDTAMTSYDTTGEADNSSAYMMTAMFHMALPDTGTNKTLKWNWGTSANQAQGLVSVVFLKGVDTASPIRSADGGQANPLPYTTGTLTYQTGDLILATCSCYYANGSYNDSNVTGWSSGGSTLAQLTALEFTSTAFIDGAWGTWSPSTGSGTVSVTTQTGPTWEDGSICAIVIKPAGAAVAIDEQRVFTRRTPRRQGNAGRFRIRPALYAPPVYPGVALAEITGDLAATEAADTAAFAGQAVIAADLAVTEAADTANFAGKVEWTGTLAATEAQDTAAFAGDVKISAALSVTEAADTAAFAGSVIVSGTLAATEATDTAAFAGDVVGGPITGTFAATEATDAAAFSGGVLVSGTLAVTEGTDTAAFAGGPIISGTLARTESPDTAAFAGSVIVSGTLARTETADTAAFAGSVLVSGTLAATEFADTANFAGSAGVEITGTLAATETTDTSAFNGSVIVSGTLARTEAADTAAFAAGVTWLGMLAVTEAKDTSAIAGRVEWTGTLSATEAKDIAAFAGGPIIAAQLAATETRDTALFFAPIPGYLASQENQDTAKFLVDVVPLPGPLNFGIGRVVVSRRL